MPPPWSVGMTFRQREARPVCTRHLKYAEKNTFLTRVKDTCWGLLENLTQWKVQASSDSQAEEFTFHTRENKCDL